jgi:hypothetical protein
MTETSNQGCRFSRSSVGRADRLAEPPTPEVPRLQNVDEPADSLSFWHTLGQRLGKCYILAPKIVSSMPGAARNLSAFREPRPTNSHRPAFEYQG